MLLNTRTIHSIAMREPCSVEQRIFKLVEETGEVTAAILADDGAANASATAVPNIAEEAVDTLICALSLLYALGLDNEEIQQVIQKKCSKWSKKLADKGF